MTAKKESNSRIKSEHSQTTSYKRKEMTEAKCVTTEVHDQGLIHENAIKGTFSEGGAVSSGLGIGPLKILLQSLIPPMSFVVKLFASQATNRSSIPSNESRRAENYHYQ